MKQKENNLGPYKVVTRCIFFTNASAKFYLLLINETRTCTIFLVIFGMRDLLRWKNPRCDIRIVWNRIIVRDNALAFLCTRNSLPCKNRRRPKGVANVEVCVFRQVVVEAVILEYVGSHICRQRRYAWVAMCCTIGIVGWSSLVMSLVRIAIDLVCCSWIDLVCCSWFVNCRDCLRWYGAFWRNRGRCRRTGHDDLGMVGLVSGIVIYFAHNTRENTNDSNAQMLYLAVLVCFGTMYNECKICSCRIYRLDLKIK